jgi:hypothetical protein
MEKSALYSPLSLHCAIALYSKVPGLRTHTSEDSILSEDVCVRSLTNALGATAQMPHIPPLLTILPYHDRVQTTGMHVFRTPVVLF